MESVILDDVDRKLVHALQLDGRAPLRTVAAVLGVSENTVARRYRRLRGAGVLRVVGAVNGSRLGYTSWLLRLQATPDAAGAIAAALARRDDTSWIYLVSGGTEVLCTTQVRSTADRDDLLLAKLPRTHRVLAMSAHALLAGYGIPTTWRGLASLDDDQAAALRPPPVDSDDTPLALDPGDAALLDALARDGRTTYAELATAAGSSVSTVRRRVEHLRHSGVLSLQLDIAAESLGFAAQARLWMTVQPSAQVAVGEALATHPEVAFVAATTGVTNLTAAVQCRDTRDLYRYLTERVAPFDAVRTLETAPVIRTVKRAGALLPT
ncbi:Lrp/AsnC family transcriptional regulator [Pseudonocardia sp. GCM10023141]|uniref:Lrp/AsnC family transcriptional regulator n=1 Tax=Pseudonocardia sp. GCM10023141 TaxID=3252653 RepID=UPI003620F4ED